VTNMYSILVAFVEKSDLQRKRKKEQNRSMFLWHMTPLTTRSKMWVRGCWLVGFAGSNSFGGMNVSFLRLLCFVRKISLRRADHSSRGVLTSVLCLNVIVKPRQ
jgi:hypothetical protein